MSDIIITRLVTDYINYNNDNQVTLIYAGTQDGQILKLVQMKKGEKLTLLTSWILDESNREKFSIQNMILAQVKQWEKKTTTNIYLNKYR